MEAVEWIDSGLSFAATWLTEDTIVHRAKEWDGRVTTVGHVIYEDDTRIVLGLSKDHETGNWSGCFAIYKSAIVQRVALVASNAA